MDQRSWGSTLITGRFFISKVRKGLLWGLMASLGAWAPAHGQSVGREAAEKYFQGGAEGPVAREPSSSSASRYLQVHVGSFLSDRAYRWGTDLEKDVGGFQAGFTYRVGEWLNTADLSLRVDYQTFNLQESSARKLSFLLLWSLPDSNSYFPLYFGVGLGPGVFLKQVPEKSSLSLDYQLIMGVRFFEVVGTTGFFLEAGLKDHIHLLSSGQFAEGVFLSVGPVFNF